MPSSGTVSGFERLELMLQMRDKWTMPPIQSSSDEVHSDKSLFDCAIFLRTLNLQASHVSCTNHVLVMYEINCTPICSRLFQSLLV
jgi:hypothetical protein